MICGILILMLFSAVAEDLSQTSTGTGSVLRLNASNYEYYMFHSGGNGMVLFHQTWCGHCRRFMPVWERLAQETSPSIFIASVDCGASAEADICRSSHVTTYPTLRYYLHRTEFDYTGSLSLDELQDFIHSTLAVHCNPILDVTTCSDKANKYAAKWLSMEAAQVTREIERLQLMIDNEESSANAGLRRWMRERKDILEIISIHRHQIMSGVHLAEQASGQYGKSDEL